MGKTLQGKKICLDAGHYRKYNQCPAIKEYFESVTVWKLHLMLKQYLEEKGAMVITTRGDRDYDRELVSRGKASEGCDLFLSLHTNASGNGMNEKVDHVAVYHLTDDKKVQCDDISKEVAEYLAPVIASTMGVSQGYKILTRKSANDRNHDGVMNDNYYGVLHGARLAGTPGLILEHGFHTHTQTVKWLLQDSNLETLARAEADAIETYFVKKQKPVVVNPTPKPTPTPSTSKVEYRIKVTNVPKDDVLYIRKKPNAKAEETGKLQYNDPNIYTIVEESNGWGKLKSGIGWINLHYTKRV